MLTCFIRFFHVCVWFVWGNFMSPSTDPVSGEGWGQSSCRYAYGGTSVLYHPGGAESWQFISIYQLLEMEKETTTILSYATNIYAYAMLIQKYDSHLVQCLPIAMNTRHCGPTVLPGRNSLESRRVSLKSWRHKRNRAWSKPRWRWWSQNGEMLRSWGT